MDFKDIPNKYRPIPFWSWNDKLDKQTTEEEILSMRDAGLGGYFMHARGGLETEYMGKEWFDNIELGVKLGEKYGMGAWAYDENGWPSGFGDGIVNGMGVEYQQKFLKYEKGEKNTKTTIANLDGYHFFYEANPFYVDLLDKKVTEKFIEAVYEPYYEKYADGIEGFFTDEPQLSREDIPWSFVLPEEFKKEYGYELLPRLTELFFDTGDYIKTRLNFWRLVTRLFRDGFTKQIYDFCEARNLKFTGHMVQEETMLTQITTSGAIMPNYKNFHIPGIDCLGRTKIDKTTIYQLTSVAEQFSREQVLTESFALTGWGVDFEELKKIYEWQMVRGVNLLCTHLYAYSLRGIRKRDYPAAFSYQEPWWDKYKLFIDSMSRIGMLLSLGRSECDTLLIHPMTTAWALYSESGKEKINEYEKSFRAVIDLLERKHVLFNLGDETIIEDEARVEGKLFVIGNRKYKTVVLAPHIVLLDTTKKLLEEFKANGGTVILNADDIESSDIVDNENILYTKRNFDDFTMYYFVNTSEEKQSVKIKSGTDVLNIITGELESFSPQSEIEAGGSLVVLDYFDKSKQIIENTCEYTDIDLSDLWQIKESDLNALTLDFCELYFDGELVGRRVPIISVQEMALSKERTVKISMKYRVKVDCVPEKIYLVSETPEIFEFIVNGKRLAPNAKGYYKDKSFKMLDLSGYLRDGENEIVINCDFSQSEETYDNIRKARAFESEKNKLRYDMEIENIYIVGDFALETTADFEQLQRNAVRYNGDFVISKPKTLLSPSNIERQGYPFFAGKITLCKSFVFDKSKSYRLNLSDKKATVVSIRVNGKEAGDIIWKPYCLDITPYIADGDNTVEITLTGTLRNLLGPHHMKLGESYAVTPAAFFKEDSIWGEWGRSEWCDGYCFIEFGIKGEKTI